MTNEEKQLLLKDLCARLPYGVFIHYHWSREGNTIDEDRELDFSDVETLKYNIENPQNDWCEISWKPYLRPMSSMTEEEKAFLDATKEIEYTQTGLTGKGILTLESYDYLNSINVDYRGLIPDLALKAPAGMYNKEESESGSDIPVPKTVDEAISTLEKILSDEDREYLLENGAISMHDSLGRWIRNEWGLWTGSELKDELMNLNKGLNHPDDMSNYIIEEFIKYWNNKI